MIPMLIARNTFREATRDRVLSGVVVAGIALLAITQLASPLALGEGRRLTVDLGLSSISVLGMLVILLVGTNLVAKEIEKKTLYNLLSRPITRHAYLIGKWAGLSAALAVASACLGGALCVVLGVRGEAQHLPGVAQAVYLAILELSLITSVAVLFSALSTPVLSSLYTLALFMVGQWSYDLRSYAAHFPKGFSNIVDFTANLVPNLPIFNIRTLAADAHTTSAVHLGVATLYAALYCACALSLATAAFENRDFK